MSERHDATVTSATCSPALSRISANGLRVACSVPRTSSDAWRLIEDGDVVKRRSFAPSDGSTLVLTTPTRWPISRTAMAWSRSKTPDKGASVGTNSSDGRTRICRLYHHDVWAPVL